MSAKGGPILPLACQGGGSPAASPSVTPLLASCTKLWLNVAKITSGHNDFLAKHQRFSVCALLQSRFHCSKLS